MDGGGGGSQGGGTGHGIFGVKVVDGGQVDVASAWKWSVAVLEVGVHGGGGFKVVGVDLRDFFPTPGGGWWCAAIPEMALRGRRSGLCLGLASFVQVVVVVVEEVARGSRRRRRDRGVGRALGPMRYWWLMVEDHVGSACRFMWQAASGRFQMVLGCRFTWTRGGHSRPPTSSDAFHYSLERLGFFSAPEHGDAAAGRRRGFAC